MIYQRSGLRILLITLCLLSVTNAFFFFEQFHFDRYQLYRTFATYEAMDLSAKTTLHVVN